jgi:outer membrane protein TolC
VIVLAPLATVVIASALAGAHPLTLDEAVALAEQRSAALDRAHTQVERAQLAQFRAQLDRVRATVDAQITELVDKPNIGGAGGSPNLVLGLSSLNAQVNAPLFSGFYVSANVERADALARASSLDVQGEKRRVTESVARAYWGIRRLAVLRAARAASLERLVESERIVKARVAAGLSPAIDENRAAQRRLELESQIADLDADVFEQSAAFRVALGLDEPIELVDSVGAFDDATASNGAPDLNTIVVDAKGAHPDVLALRARADAVHAETTMARSDFYPHLSAFAQAQLGNNPQIAGAGVRAVQISPNPIAGTVGDLQAGLVLSMNIFDTLHTLHAVQDAEHRERLALADVRGAELEVEQATTGAHARVGALAQRRTALVKLRVLAKDNLDVIEKSYQRGDALLLDLLDATVSAAQIDAQIADVDAQLTEALVLLRIISGHVDHASASSQTSTAGSTP